MKKCTACKKQKQKSEFYFNESKGGYDTRCKPCKRMSNRRLETQKSAHLKTMKALHEGRWFGTE
jgi:hypothetical protein